jgi:hypothetical protein
VGEEMEKIVRIDLRIAQDVPEDVSKRSFYLQQWFKSDLIDLLEGIAVHIRKILDF